MKCLIFVFIFGNLWIVTRGVFPCKKDTDGICDCICQPLTKTCWGKCLEPEITWPCGTKCQPLENACETASGYACPGGMSLCELKDSGLHICGIENKDFWYCTKQGAKEATCNSVDSKIWTCDVQGPCQPFSKPCHGSHCPPGYGFCDEEQICKIEGSECGKNECVGSDYTHCPEKFKGSFCQKDVYFCKKENKCYDYSKPCDGKCKGDRVPCKTDPVVDLCVYESEINRCRNGDCLPLNKPCSDTSCKTGRIYCENMGEEACESEKTHHKCADEVCCPNNLPCPDETPACAPGWRACKKCGNPYGKGYTECLSNDIPCNGKCIKGFCLIYEGRKCIDCKFTSPTTIQPTTTHNNSEPMASMSLYYILLFSFLIVGPNLK